MKLTRRYRFSASHRLATPALSDEENRQLYGKCNNPFGHGHDYVLDVTVEGAPDKNGLVVERLALDQVVRSRVLDQLDHRNLNEDVPAMANVVPTTENLASAIRTSLERDWPLAARLSRVRISETDRNIFELEGSSR
ncbi:MAG TPA: 6-carboxytetrahydropterin synthase [Bryobacteraceae bacterium]|nr:6-carboxytetrahydropterin synthase [Bryobacteraceae bacterium]